MCVCSVLMLPVKKDDTGLLMEASSLSCYGRLTVVSNVDDGGFALNVDNEQKVCRAIMKRVQWSNAGIVVDRMHTR
jgi:hypothetical protein